MNFYSTCGLWGHEMEHNGHSNVISATINSHIHTYRLTGMSINKYVHTYIHRLYFFRAAPVQANVFIVNEALFCSFD